MIQFIYKLLSFQALQKLVERKERKDKKHKGFGEKKNSNRGKMPKTKKNMRMITR